jgi:NTP pyrophosphatase (non-canonical NTP hydrolase)
MNKDEAKILLDEFLSSKSQQVLVAFAIDYLAAICEANAKLRGFHDDEEDVLSAVDQGLFDEFGASEKPPRQQEIKQWLNDAILQAELARQASEIGEAVEAVRKPGPDHHCPEFSNFAIEEADCVIRIGDTCSKRGIQLGKAIVAKLVFNASRPFKHGKNS